LILHIGVERISSFNPFQPLCFLLKPITQHIQVLPRSCTPPPTLKCLFANSVFPLFRSTLGIDVPPATLLRANEVIE
jgi:hypothetical protein